MVWEDASYIGFALNTPAPANYVDWKAQNKVFTDMAATRYTGAALTGDGVHSNYPGGKRHRIFSTCWAYSRARPAFTAEEDKTNAKVAVISYGVWHRRYGGTHPSSGEGSCWMESNDGSRSHAGELLFPRARCRLLDPHGFHARRVGAPAIAFPDRGGATETRRDATTGSEDMERVAAQLQRQYPENAQLGATVVAIQKDFAGDARSGLWCCKWLRCLCY